MSTVLRSTTVYAPSYETTVDCVSLRCPLCGSYVFRCGPTRVSQLSDERAKRSTPIRCSGGRGSCAGEDLSIMVLVVYDDLSPTIEVSSPA